ncbi:MAG: PD-(D/E)XK nuclease family protein [Verrucomicrobiae bacterium]|nr:PD-(D/E)XK nuclease family protein [Verrucomicrobiae bacterium]
MNATLEAPALEAVSAEKQGRSVEELSATVSASRLNTWMACRLKFWFRYVEGIKKPPTPALFVGSTIHKLLQAWNVARWRKETYSQEEWREIFLQNWEDQPEENPIDWQEEEDAEREAAWNLIQCYFRETPIKPDEKPEGVEVYVETDLSMHGLPKLIGVMDLVRSGGRIVDFKTTGQTPSPEKASFLNEVQTSCYAILYRESTGHAESGIELHHLVKTKTPKVAVVSLPPMSQLQETRLLRLMQSYVDGLDRRDITPSVGFHCAGCEFLNECKRWG